MNFDVASVKSHIKHNVLMILCTLNLIKTENWSGLLDQVYSRKVYRNFKFL